MSRLIKDGDISLDGTLPRYQKEKNAFLKLQEREELDEQIGVDHPTLWKILDKNTTIYIKDGSTIIAIDGFISSTRFISKWQLILCDSYLGESMYLELSDYGKKWSINRKDLEDVSNN